MGRHAAGLAGESVDKAYPYFTMQKGAKRELADKFLRELRAVYLAFSL